MSDYERGYQQGLDDAHRCEKRHAHIDELEKQLALAHADREAMRGALETIAAQSSGIVGSTSRADCMAAIARVALRNANAALAQHPAGGATSETQL